MDALVVNLGERFCSWLVKLCIHSFADGRFMNVLGSLYRSGHSHHVDGLAQQLEPGYSFENGTESWKNLWRLIKYGVTDLTALSIRVPSLLSRQLLLWLFTRLACHPPHLLPRSPAQALVKLGLATADEAQAVETEFASLEQELSLAAKIPPLARLVLAYV